MAAAEETLIFTTKRKELFLFDRKLFRTVGVNENNSNVYYVCYTDSIVKCGGRIKKTALGEIIQTVACIDTCHEIPDAKLFAMRARKRLFDLVRLQPHRSIRQCYNV
jgi:hypothetical protein